MTSYKLTYFSNKGLAEPIRFLFYYAGIKFEDVRLTEEEWLKFKPSTPFGQMPILEVDNKKINQSTAICRYLAKQFDLTGQNDWEDLEIDATVNTIHDFRLIITAPHHETNLDAKARKAQIARNAIPFFTRRLDEQVALNSGFLVGGKLTWADIVFVALLDVLNFRANCDILEGAKNLRKLVDVVLGHPKIKGWLVKRPKSDY